MKFCIGVQRVFAHFLQRSFFTEEELQFRQFFLRNPENGALQRDLLQTAPAFEQFANRLRIKIADPASPFRQRLDESFPHQF